MRQFLDPVLRAPRYFGRYEKPRYYSSESPIIVVPGSSNAPIILVIAGRVYERTSDMECNLNRSGEDGLNLVTLAANTPYYLYAIIGEDGYPHLLADIQDPSRGPQGYGAWTYLGAFSTRSAAAEVYPFNASNGSLFYSGYIESESHTGDLVRTAETFSTMPATVLTAYMLVAHNGAGAVESYVLASSADTSVYAIYCRSQAANVINYSYGWIPIITGKTIYIILSDALTTGSVYLYGWKEDVSAWL